jgi:hypothetical protein
MKEIIIEVPDRFGQELKPEKVNSEIKGDLVRCRECRRKGTYDCPIYASVFGKFGLHDDWYCANGERR